MWARGDKCSDFVLNDPFFQIFELIYASASQKDIVFKVTAEQDFLLLLVKFLVTILS